MPRGVAVREKLMPMTLQTLKRCVKRGVLTGELWTRSTSSRRMAPLAEDEHCCSVSFGSRVIVGDGQRG